MLVLQGWAWEGGIKQTSDMALHCLLSWDPDQRGHRLQLKSMIHQVVQDHWGQPLWLVKSKGGRLNDSPFLSFQKMCKPNHSLVCRLQTQHTEWNSPPILTHWTQFPSKESFSTWTQKALGLFSFLGELRVCFRSPCGSFDSNHVSKQHPASLENDESFVSRTSWRKSPLVEKIGHN